MAVAHSWIDIRHSDECNGFSLRISDFFRPEMKVSVRASRNGQWSTGSGND